MPVKFKWDRMYKWEDNIEYTINNEVEEFLMEYYEVDDLLTLTAEQIESIRDFAEENSYSVMARGLFRVVNDWENENE